MTARATVVALLVMLAFASPAFAATSPPADVKAADALAATPPGRDRDQALARWGSRARLADLLWVLRRDPAELAGAEAPLVESALDRTSQARVALRRRLVLRLALADPKRGRAHLAELSPVASGIPARPRASVFRVATLLPDSGGYEGLAGELRSGLAAGLAWNARLGRPTPDLVPVSTGDGRASAVIEAADRAATTSAVLVGETQSAATAVLAGLARALGLPLVVPAALDEAAAHTGPPAFPIGPSDRQRGRALARSALSQGARRVGVLVSSALGPSAFVRGFEDEAQVLGSPARWRRVYAAGAIEFRAAAIELATERIEVLLWDGDPRELEALARQLAAERVRLELCGGSALDPERHHAATRAALEGARLVGDEWRLAAGSQAVLDSAVKAGGGDRVESGHVRGWLAARLISIGLSNGALAPEELIEALASLTRGDAELARLGIVTWPATEAILPVSIVRGGRPVPAD